MIDMYTRVLPKLVMIYTVIYHLFLSITAAEMTPASHSLGSQLLN